MGYKILLDSKEEYYKKKRLDAKHYCDKPGHWTGVWSGTIVQCDCGKRWKLKHGEVGLSSSYWVRRYLWWPKDKGNRDIGY